MDLARIAEIAIEFTQLAGIQVLRSYGQVQALHKGDGTLVTDADRAAEQLIRSHLARHFPEHAVFGEEFGLTGEADNPWRWYLDPIDGTSNFVFGIPVWGVSAGLTYEGKPVLGVFDMPLTGDLYWGWQGGGAYLNGRRLSVYDPPEAQHTDLITTSSSVLERYDLTCLQKVRCLGSASHALAAVAAGTFVAAVHDNWKIHDMAATLCMCWEAGAISSDHTGSPFEDFVGQDPKAEGPTLVVAGPHTHAGLLPHIHPR